jgi:hypothetical protein
LTANPDAVLPWCALAAGVCSAIVQLVRAPGVQAHQIETESYSEQIADLRERLHQEEEDHDLTRDHVFELKRALTQHGIKIPDLDYKHHE